MSEASGPHYGHTVTSMLDELLDRVNAAEKRRSVAAAHLAAFATNHPEVAMDAHLLAARRELITAAHAKAMVEEEVLS